MYLSIYMCVYLYAYIETVGVPTVGEPCWHLVQASESKLYLAQSLAANAAPSLHAATYKWGLGCRDRCCGCAGCCSLILLGLQQQLKDLRVAQL